MKTHITIVYLLVLWYQWKSLTAHQSGHITLTLTLWKNHRVTESTDVGLRLNWRMSQQHFFISVITVIPYCKNPSIHPPTHSSSTTFPELVHSSSRFIRWWTDDAHLPRNTVCKPPKGAPQKAPLLNAWTTSTVSFRRGGTATLFQAPCRCTPTTALSDYEKDIT